MNTKVLCLYHDKCSDGLCSAFVVGKKYGFDNVEFVACNYRTPLPDIAGRDVVIVDFSFKPEVLLPVLSSAKSLIFLDHHKSAMKDWDDQDVVDEVLSIRHERSDPESIHIQFNMRLSGAGMTWLHFFPDEEAPMIVRYCQEYDLWNFNLPNSLPNTKELINGVYSTDRFEQGDMTLYNDLTTQEQLDKMIERGIIVLSEKHKLLKSMIKSNNHRFVKVIYGLYIPIMHVNYTHASEAGVLLNQEAIDYNDDTLVSHADYYEIEKAGGIFAATYTENWEAGVRVFSLRSDNNYELASDVSEVARRFGGGGHKHAAGFSVPMQVPLKYIFSKSLVAQAYVKLMMWLYKKK